MTDLIERTLYRLGEQRPGLISRSGADMNRRRQFFSTIGLGFLLVGGAAAAPREEFAAAAKPHRALPPTAPEHRPEYKVLTVPAGDSVEDAFNAVARESFQYAGLVQRYGHPEFIFVKWVPLDPAAFEDVSS
jgi:hypothetical protein